MSETRVAVVTGANSGIGLAISSRFVQAGIRVVMVDRSKEVAKTARDLHVNLAVPWIADMGESEQVLGTADYVNANLGRCDVLVNNAGVHPKVNGQIVALENTILEDWEMVLRINLTAPFLLCKQFLPGMRERRWGRIVNISSRAGRTWSDRAGSHYTASKAGLIGLTRKMAGDYAPYGITVNCVVPGQVETPLARTSVPETLAKAIAGTPVGRLGTADEVASCVAYLASDAAAFITGAVVDINGGSFIG